MNRIVSPLIAFAALVLVAGAPAFAQAPAPAPKPAAKAAAPVPTPDALAVKKIVEERFPGAQVKHIAKTAYFGGVYEVMFDDQMIYVDPKVNYLIVGQIYDAKTRTNLTERKVREINRIDFAELPLDLAIKKVKGNGTRKLAVFSDADCPFCARLEQTLKDIDDVTVYTFLYPIDQLHPDAARKSRVIWCSPDRTKSWDEFFANGTLPPNAGDCDNPIAATQALGQKLRVSATPTLVFADGSIVPGALPKESLENELKRADSEMRKVAATR